MRKNKEREANFLRAEILLNKLVAEQICSISNYVKPSLFRIIINKVRFMIWRIKDFVSYIGEYSENRD